MLLERNRVLAKCEFARERTFKTKGTRRMTIVELLTSLFGVTVIAQRNDATMSAVALRVSDGRRLIMVERTYREGLKVLLQPTDADIELIQGGDLSALWKSDHAVPLDDIASWPPNAAPEKRS